MKTKAYSLMSRLLLYFSVGMEVISIDGIEYVRAAAIARKYKYTSDYIGQLCRAGKVDAKLVGRTWYVSPDSLDAHKNGRYQKDSQDEKTKQNTVQRKSSRIDVEAVPRAETAKTIANARQHNPQYLRRIEWKPVKYEADRSELLPPLRQQERSVSLPVAVAEAEKLTIEDSSRPIALKAEPLPEVSLRGKVTVSSAEDNFSDADNSIENIDISSVEEVEGAVHMHPKSKDRKTSIKIVSTEEDDEMESKESENEAEEDAKFTYDVPVIVTDRASFTPRSVTKKRVPAPDLEIKSAKTEKSTRIDLVIIAVLVVSAVVLGVLLLLLEQVTIVDVTGQSSSLDFSSPTQLLK